MLSSAWEAHTMPVGGHVWNSPLMLRSRAPPATSIVNAASGRGSIAVESGSHALGLGQPSCTSSSTAVISGGTISSRGP